MKKFLGILAIAGVLVACDNAGSEGAKTDSNATTTVDSNTTTTTTVTPATPDSASSTTTTTTVDSASTLKVDSPAHQ